MKPEKPTRISTSEKGIFYYPSVNRETKKADKRFVLRYRFENKQYEEALGFASQGWNLPKAKAELGRLKYNQRTGSGPTTLKALREAAKEEEEAKAAEKLRQKKEALTFGTYFEKKYLPIAKTSKKAQSWGREEQLYEKWLKPVLGDRPFRQINHNDLDKVKATMEKEGRAQRSIEYCFAVFRQCWNRAVLDKLVVGPSPTKSVKLGKLNNARMRFLTKGEADALLADAKKRSKKLHSLCLMALHCGLRAGEIFALKWRDVDLKDGTLTIWDTKNVTNRIAYMTDPVKDVLKKMKKGKPGDLVFPDRKGKQIRAISKAFDRSVEKVGLNKHVDSEDRRQKVVFHSLRHTFASWHVQSGTSLYVVRDLLGHASIATTEKYYAHLCQENYRAATNNFNKKFT